MSRWPSLDPESEWVRLDVSALPRPPEEGTEGAPHGEGGHGGHHE